MKPDLDAFPPPTARPASPHWYQRHGPLIVSTVSLISTLLIGWFTLRQVTTHFKIERTSAFLSRFNAADFIQAREVADRWLETNEKPEQLYQRSKPSAGAAADPDAVRLIQHLRLLSNFFEEFGSSIKNHTLDDDFAFELLGVTSYAYADKLTPFICDTRHRDEATGNYESHTYEEVFWLEKWVMKKARYPRLLPTLKYKPVFPLTPAPPAIKATPVPAPRIKPAP